MPPTQTLFLVRHAIAMERGDKWPDDAKRPLSHAGAARMRRAVKGIAALKVNIAVVLSSPAVRAMETAEILVHGLSPRPELIPLPALAPGAPAGRVAEALAPFGKRAGLALVGHEPGLGELAAWLIGARLPVPFKKGGACRIDVATWPPARQGTLVWLATPRMLRALGDE